MNNIEAHALSTDIIFKDEARERVYRGLKKAADAVSCTMGPRGKTVLIQHKNKQAVVTRDGVTVSKAIRLKDPVERMGADLVREAASRTNDVAGDGTTTATVLTHALVHEGLKLAAAGFSTIALCSSIEHAAKEIVASLRSSAKAVTTRTEIAQVGTISANGDGSVGDLIADAMDSVGRDGIVTIEDAKGMATTLSVVEGMQLDRGYLSPYFVTSNERMHAVYRDAFVLLTDKKISTLRDIVPILEHVQQSQRALLIVAEDVEGEALQGLILNRIKANLQVVAIRAPGFGMLRTELMRDLEVLTGATLASSATGRELSKLTAADLGLCAKLVVDAKTTTIVGSGRSADAVKEHVADLRHQLEDVTLTTDDVFKLKSRIAKLAGGVAVIRVGGATELEMNERKYRIEDALNATRAAADEGIVAGGGVALLHAARSLSTTTDAGVQAVVKACQAPLARIVENADLSMSLIVHRLDELQDGMCYDAATDSYVDAFESGIIDPVKVTRCALEHAASVACTFLSMDAVIYDEDECNHARD